METKLLFAKQTFYYGSHHFWVMSYGNRELSYQKTQSKQALTVASKVSQFLPQFTMRWVINGRKILIGLWGIHFHYSQLTTCWVVSEITNFFMALTFLFIKTLTNIKKNLLGSYWMDLLETRAY